MTMPPPRDADDTVSLISLQLRIPERLRDELGKAARDNGRSLNSEITQRLTKSLEGSPSLTEAERAAERAEYERAERAERAAQRAEMMRVELDNRLKVLTQQEHELRARWDAERERAERERARLLDMMERQARAEAELSERQAGAEALRKQVQDLGERLNEIERQKERSEKKMRLLDKERLYEERREEREQLNERP